MKDNVCVISSDLIQKIDDTIRSPKDRALSIEIQRNPGIESEFEAVVVKWNITTVLSRGSYLSINEICSRRGLDEFVHKDGIAGAEGSVE